MTDFGEKKPLAEESPLCYTKVGSTPPPSNSGKRRFYRDPLQKTKRLIVPVVTGILGWGRSNTKVHGYLGIWVVFFIGVQNMWDGQMDPQLLGETQDQEIES